MLQVQMQLEQAKVNEDEFLRAEARRGRAGDAAYEARYQSWARSRIEGMDQEIENFTRQLEQMQLAATTDVPQTGPSYGYNPQSYVPGQGYSYGAVSGGGELNRMNTIGRSHQYDVGYYGPSAAAEGGHQDSTQRSSFVEEALRQQQEQLAQQDQQWLMQQNPDWLAEQERQWSKEQREQRGRRQPPNQGG